MWGWWEVPEWQRHWRRVVQDFEILCDDKFFVKIRGFLTPEEC
jgi:hypothetical protein